MRLPGDVERVVRMTSVPPTLAGMFEHLPEPLVLEADLPADPEAVPLAARQLLKLAMRGDRVVLARLGASPSCRMTVSLGQRRCELSPDQLQADLGAVTRVVLSALCDAADFFRLLHVFAFQSDAWATLHKIVHHMLESTDVDKALHAMLSGITAGHGLGFHRAALFLHDPARGVFVGSKAIGPASEAEAHRIWEEIESADKSIDQLITEYSSERFESPFQRFIQSVDLAPGDEVTEALAARRPLLFRAPPRNPSLASLGVADEFVLAAIRPHGTTLGLVLADDLYGGTSPILERLATFAFFIDQTALVWENLSLLRRVEALARIDGLTGLLNRRELEARLELELSRCVRSGRTLSLMILDIDHFKEVNDRHGHEAGDAVLRKLGDVLRSALRGHDIAGRYGGDEFVIVLPETAPGQLAQTAQRIGALAREAHISLSIGGASWPTDCPLPSALLSVADANLYKSKRHGRRRAYLGPDESYTF